MQTAPIDIVFVCTANINRSPMAAALLARHVAALVPPVPGSVTISSAGLLEAGYPSSPHAIAALAARGIDLRAHRSVKLGAQVVRDADLVLTMERGHLRAAAVLVPGALAKTFTLREFVRRGLERPTGAGARWGVVGGAGGPAGVADAAGVGSGSGLGAWLEALNAGRKIAALLRDDPADDVWDPVGGSRADFERTADELDVLTGHVAQVLFAGSR